MELMSINEAADYLRCSRRTVYNRIEDGTFPSYRVGKRRLVERTELDKALKKERDMSNAEICREADLRLLRVQSDRRFGKWRIKA